MSNITIVGYIGKFFNKIKKTLLWLNNRPKTVAIVFLMLILYMPISIIWMDGNIYRMNQIFDHILILELLDQLYKYIHIVWIIWLVLIVVTIGFIYFIYKTLKSENSMLNNNEEWLLDYFTHNTYATNYKMASFFLENATSTVKGKEYNIVSSILFSAFSLEAYLNHQGVIEFNEEWGEWDLEKKPSFKEKLLKLTTTYDITINFNQEPYSIINPLFVFRNSIVHGRTETIQKKVRNPSNNSNGALQNLASSTDRFSNIKNAKKISSCTKKIIENLNSHSKNKIAKSELWSLGQGSYQVKR